MTFNQNLGNTSGRAEGGNNAGPPRSGGGFNQGGGNAIANLLITQVGARFGLPGLIIAGVVIFFLNGGGASFLGGEQQTQVHSPSAGQDTLAHCRTYEDANTYDDCRIQATAVALDKFWEDTLPAEKNINYTKPGLYIGSGRVDTACGVANASQTGPFYCPGDEKVYFATPFFAQLKQMGGSDGEFSQMYVVAHEFGHHIQKLEGTLGLSDYSQPGADSNAVKIELQADCYAGLWASHADKGEDAVLDPLTQSQVDQAVKTAQSIGDDAIQKSAGEFVNPEKWTHGSSEQRVDAFLRGYQGGTMHSCAASFNR